MNRTNLIRLSGLATMAGSVVFALVLVLRPWLNSMLAEAVTLPMFFLLLVVVSLALVAIVGLLREARHGWLEIAACGVSLVGVVLVFMGVLLGFAGIFVIYVGVLVATGGLVVLATLTTGTNTLPWWGRVALMVGGPSFILVRYLYHPLEDSLMGVPWLVVGFAIFRAAGREPVQPSQLR
jgi:hypothetical protein